MKRISIIFIVFLIAALSIITQRPIFAHGSGFPPFFKIDGELANPYFLQNVGVYSSILNIPQDDAGKNYLPDESIDFEIDKTKLETVFTPDVMDKLKFAWNFGDGTKGDGEKNSHSYKKPGSYILEITADYGDPNTQPLLIESALIQIVPDKNYKLPHAVIVINGKQGEKKNYNILDFDLNDSLTFDGRSSKSDSSKITSYSWDFGDDIKGEGSSVSHRYQLPQAFATAILRVKDNKGFFSDSYVNIRNSGKNEPGGLKNFLRSIIESILKIFKVKS